MRKNGTYEIYKMSSFVTYSPLHIRMQYSASSLIRDSVLFLFLVINFTAVSLLFLPSGIAQYDNLSTEGSLFWQIAVSIFLAISIFLQTLRRVPIRRIIVAAAPLIPIMIWIILSVTWSDFPDFSIRRAARLVMETVTVILFAAAYRDQYRLLRIIYLTFGFILMLDVAFLGMPDVSFTPVGYAGVHDHKNSAGFLCLFALPVFLLAIMDRRIFPSRILSIAFALCCISILALSLAKTSIALAPVCIVLTIGFISIGRARPVTASVMVLIVVAICALFTVIISSVGVDTILMTTTGDPTVTGRDLIWDYALSLFWQSPIIGKGYGGIWNVGIISVLHQNNLGVSFVLKHAHNGYIEILSELGMVGLLLVIVFIIATFFHLWRRIPHAEVLRINFVAIYTAFAIFLQDISGTSIFLSGSALWMYLLLVMYASILICPLTPGTGHEAGLGQQNKISPGGRPRRLNQ